MADRNIYYSDKYYDDVYEYRYVSYRPFLLLLLVTVSGDLVYNRLPQF